MNPWKSCHREDTIYSKDHLYPDSSAGGLREYMADDFIFLATEIPWITQSPHTKDSYLITFVAHVHDIHENVLLLTREQSRGSVGDDFTHSGCWVGGGRSRRSHRTEAASSIVSSFFGSAAAGAGTSAGAEEP
jgi:hypothetical protein